MTEHRGAQGTASTPGSQLVPIDRSSEKGMKGSEILYSKASFHHKPVSPQTFPKKDGKSNFPRSKRVSFGYQPAPDSIFPVPPIADDERAPGKSRKAVIRSKQFYQTLELANNSIVALNDLYGVDPLVNGIEATVSPALPFISIF